MLSFLKKVTESNRPLISVIIPNYNNAPYLNQCIDSILKQTYSNIEIVICDDSSTDNSREVLSKYESYDNINIIYSSSNLGVSKTRDIAIRQSKGKYITTLDSDDYYCDDNKLKKEWKLISKYRKKGKQIIAFSYVKLIFPDGEEKRFQQGKEIKDGNLLIPIITRKYMIPRDFLFLKESYFEVGGFDPTINLYEDWDLKIRLASKYEFYYTSLTGIVHRLTGSGLSSCAKEDHKNAIQRVFDKNLHLVQAEKRKYCLDEISKIVN